MMAFEIAICIVFELEFVQYFSQSTVICKWGGRGSVGSRWRRQLVPLIPKKIKRLSSQEDTHMDSNQEQYICKSEGFSTRGFPKYNEGEEN